MAKDSSFDVVSQVDMQEMDNCVNQVKKEIDQRYDFRGSNASIELGEKEVKIMDDWYKVKASVEKINAFSAHADYTETLDWLKSIDTSQLKRIFLVHGENDAQEYLQNYLKENGFENVTIVKYGESYELD